MQVCRDVVPTFESAGQRRKKNGRKETEKKRGRSRGMDKESLKGTDEL